MTLIADQLSTSISFLLIDAYVYLYSWKQMFVQFYSLLFHLLVDS